MQGPNNACLRFVRAVKNSMLEIGGHDAVNSRRFEVLKAMPGRIEGTFLIEKENLNRARTLHGGMIATLVDTAGSLAVASRGLFRTGVSTDLSSTFVRAGGTAGETINVIGEVINMGRTLAYTRVELRHSVTGDILAYGSHTKYIRGCADETSVEFDEHGELIRGELPKGA
ncbi:hypothetical protein MCUN1_000934 [Malassezia cuniculi]|uniref:Thioesterase domain-containing protein n=1 Tax=Malassezia cuniculi TaxID=948313 RepID=A0AAF0EWL6_9BASI|nr:hypothetical protein MCUN1_000934 [Malassezia cuniculi]